MLTRFSRAVLRWMLCSKRPGHKWGCRKGGFWIAGELLRKATNEKSMREHFWDLCSEISHGLCLHVSTAGLLTREQTGRARLPAWCEAGGRGYVQAWVWSCKARCGFSFIEANWGFISCVSQECEFYNFQHTALFLLVIFVLKETWHSREMRSGLKRAGAGMR